MEPGAPKRRINGNKNKLKPGNMRDNNTRTSKVPEAEGKKGGDESTIGEARGKQFNIGGIESHKFDGSCPRTSTLTVAVATKVGMGAKREIHSRGSA